jgi:rhamnulokinase
MARDQVIAVPGHPQVQPLADRWNTWHIKKWSEQPKRRQLPRQAAERLEPVSDPPIRRDDVHLRHESCRFQSGWDVGGVTGVCEREPLSPIEPPQNCERPFAQLTAAVIEHESHRAPPLPSYGNSDGIAYHTGRFPNLGTTAMTATRKLLAVDLGAESGRGVLGSFDGQRLQLDIVHRFPNGPVQTLDTVHWDVLRLHAEILNCLRAAKGMDSVGIDTWGIDFALLGRGGTLLGNPRHYRDPHTEGVMEAAFQRVPRAEIYHRTGLQFMRINSLYQLLALQRDRSPLLDAAETILFVPDLFHYFLTGIKVNEFTEASTSQMLDPHTRTWAYDLIEKFGLPTKMLGTIVQPGTVLGPLRTAVATDTGLTPVPVIVPATHDTGSAVAAVPARGDSWAFISSGTWSLLGTELPQPLVTDAALAANFTNEGGVAGTTRFLKNIMGLWLVQECRRNWEKAGKTFNYDEMVKLAEAATPFTSLVDPDDPAFLLPPNMPVAIGEFCRKTGQPTPTEPGAVIRCCLESLALKYRWVLEKLEGLVGKRLDAIHVVGGGSQNALLCQWTADATGRPVLAGPVEATALGNVLVQMLGLGLIGSLADGREVVRRSVTVTTYEPRDGGRWDEQYQRFVNLVRG